MVAEWLSALRPWPDRGKRGHLAAFHLARVATSAWSPACRGSLDPRGQVWRLSAEDL